MSLCVLCTHLGSEQKVRERQGAIEDIVQWGFSTFEKEHELYFLFLDLASSTKK